MSKRTLLQRGSSCSDLFVYAHIEGSYIAPRVKAVTSDAFVTELHGAGTSAYRHLIAGRGGWGSYVHEIASEIGHPFRRSCLITWSAGSQVALEAVQSKDTPDAIVMLDGLYGSKPQPSKMGDGKVVWTAALEALATYAIQAVRGEKRLVLFHSNIPTPYASSKECCEAVQAFVEKKCGTMEALDLPPSYLDNHACKEAWHLGNFYVVEFAGMDAKEHILEAHLWRAACELWIPWLTEDVCAAPTDPLPPTYPSTPQVRDLRSVRPMMTGEDVRAWQSFLVKQGVTVSVDGVFGPKTEAATRTWQTAYALPQTGVVDRKVREVAQGAGLTPTGQGVPAIAPPDPVASKPSTWTEAILFCARRDLDRPTVETAHNDGPRIREMLRNVGIAWPAEWCSACSSTWIFEAAGLLGQNRPVKGSAGAKALMGQFQEVGRFVTAAQVRNDPSLLKPGMVCFWDRGTPEQRWLGHVGVCEVAGGGETFTTIEGNGGDGRRVARVSRKISDPKFLGAGWLE